MKIIKHLILISGLIVFSFLSSINTVQATGVWSAGTAGGESRSEFTSVIFGDKVYNWGGNSPSASNKMDIYDISTDSWSTGATGGTARWGNSAVTSGGYIYYWGGNDDINALNTINIYNIATNSWSTGTAGGTPRMWHSAVVSNGLIYFWGGVNDAFEPLDTVDIYDIATNTWDTGQAGGTARFSHSSIAYNGNIYSWGGTDGFDFLNTVDIYNIASDDWSTGTAGGTARWEFYSSSLYEGKIYSWGGSNNVGTLLNSMDIYDVATDSWSVGASGGTARKNYGSAIYNGKIYYFGGEKLVAPLTLNRTNTVDIYDTFEQAPPEFNNLPENSQPINLEEGQVITTDNYVIEVWPTSEFGIEKVEFYIDDVLICTDTQGSDNGIYSCNWDTTQYHSDIKIIVYDILGHTTVLERSAQVTRTEAGDVTVDLPTELPQSGIE